jgi:polyphosphate kinase
VADDQQSGAGPPPETGSTDETDSDDGPTDPATDAGPAVDLDDPTYYLNRELSEVAFQRRVLNEAVDERNPLLERVKFLAIFTQNMDEFFRKRVGGLRQQMAAGMTEPTVDGLTPEAQWSAILEATEPMFERQAETYREIRSELAAEGIRIEDYDDLAADERAGLREYFRESVMPTLTPLTFDPAHPFPHISNLSLSLAVLTREEPGASPVFSRVKVPGNRPRLIRVGEDTRYVLLEDVIAGNLDLLFPNVEVVDCSTFRVTRNAEVRRNEEIAEDLVEQIQEVIRERRFARVIRLEIEEDAPREVRDLLVEQLDLDGEAVFDLPGPLDYRDLMSLLDLERPALKRDPWEPRDHPRLPAEDVDVFAEIRRKDILVHHPYHSFQGTVQRFLDEAARDPDVLAIKAAIYRTAEDSRVVRSLIEVERLEEEGIHVAYGKLGYKTHTKTALVVREEEDGVRLYSHVATGNYHSETAKQYEDLGLLTARRAIGQDLVKLFNYFTGHSLHEEYDRLLIAPTNMRERFVERIRREADHAREGRAARIVAKTNRLEDPEITRELYEASRAGVDIDLVVRDICRLRPGIEGVSENVSVRSIVGRFLEHSRVWYFHDDGEPEYFLGSADWMQRNLDDRVEAVVPVEDPELRTYLQEFLDTLLSDNRRAWEMQPDGTYVQQRPDGDAVVDTHQRFMERASETEPAPRDDPVAVDLEGPLAPDADEVDDAIRIPEEFAEPSLDEVIRTSDVGGDAAGGPRRGGPPVGGRVGREAIPDSGSGTGGRDDEAVGEREETDGSDGSNGNEENEADRAVDPDGDRGAGKSRDGNGDGSDDVERGTEADGDVGAGEAGDTDSGGDGNTEPEGEATTGDDRSDESDGETADGTRY